MLAMYLKNVFSTKLPTMRDMKFSMRWILNNEIFRTMSCVNVFPSSGMKLSAVFCFLDRAFSIMKTKE